MTRSDVAIAVPRTDCAAPADRRARRVTVLLTGIILLSIADLLITVTHLRTIGMVEANPIAMFIIDTTQSTLSLACYKSLTVLICVALLHKLRHSLQSEIAAWGCLIILAGLTLWWGHYSNHTDAEVVIAIQQSELFGREWITLAPDGFP